MQLAWLIRKRSQVLQNPPSLQDTCRVGRNLNAGANLRQCMNCVSCTFALELFPTYLCQSG